MTEQNWGVGFLVKVIIADDHALFVEGMRRMLEHESDISLLGIASNGEEAVSMAAELSPDVVILDVAMPILNGIEAAKRIRVNCPNTRILMLSAYSYESYLNASIEAGANGYISKNTPPRSLLYAVRMVVDGLGIFRSVDIHNLVASFSRKPSTRATRNDLRNRELELLKLASRGMSNRMIANELSLSQDTVRSHFANIFRKLNVKSRTEAVMCACKKGLISINNLEKS